MFNNALSQYGYSALERHQNDIRMTSFISRDAITNQIPECNVQSGEDCFGLKYKTAYKCPFSVPQVECDMQPWSCVTSHHSTVTSVRAWPCHHNKKKIPWSFILMILWGALFGFSLRIACLVYLLKQIMTTYDNTTNRTNTYLVSNLPLNLFSQADRIATMFVRAQPC